MLEFFRLYFKPAFRTTLYPFLGVNDAKLVLMLFILPPLPHALPRLAPQLSQALLELLVFLLPFLRRTALELDIECLRAAPFLEREGFYLEAEEEHHVVPGRLVWIGFEEMRHRLVVSKLRIC